MKKKGILAYLLVITLLQGGVSAKIKFDNLAINEKNEVLFTIQDTKDSYQYKALVKTAIDKNKSKGVKDCQVLTVYPQYMQKIGKTDIIQMQNTLGIYWYDTQKRVLTLKRSFESFASFSYPPLKYLVSPNSNYAIYQEKDKDYTGRLVLEEVVSGKTITLDKESVLNYNTVPAAWGVKDGFLIYEKEGNLYFTNPVALFSNVEADEVYRKVGSGIIASITPIEDGYIYIDNDIVYKIKSNELYTSSLYSQVIGKGQILGRLSKGYNLHKDKFYISPDSRRLAILEASGLYTLYLTNIGANKKGVNKSDYMSVLSQATYIDNSLNVTDKRVFFVMEGGEYKAYLFLKTIGYEVKASKILILDMCDSFKRVLLAEDCEEIYLSEDKSKVAFNSAKAFYIYDTSDWKKVAEVKTECVVSAAWQDSSTVFIGDCESVKKFDIKKNKTSVIVLSSVATCNWCDLENVEARTATGGVYNFNFPLSSWSYKEEGSGEVAKRQNSSYRLFTTKAKNYLFENALYLKTLTKSASNIAVFFEPMEELGQRKTVRLVIDCQKDAQGLFSVLAVLKKHNITAHFFLNGEFIRRYPKETSLLATSGYECNNLFFSLLPLVSGAYKIDESFITKGLARCEDEFYSTTGRELSLLWHAPGYKVESRVIEYGKKAGYTYFSTDNIILEPAVLGSDGALTKKRVLSVYTEALNKLSNSSNKSSEENVLTIPITLGQGVNGGLSLSDILEDVVNTLISKGCVFE